MGIARRLLLQMIGVPLALTLRAEPTQTINLGPYVGPSPIESAKVEWAMPHGRQVFDGIPFQIDGAVLLYGSSAAQAQNPGPRKVENIPVGRRFDRLDLLGATDTNGVDHDPIAHIRFLYADGTTAVLDLVYGGQMRGWQGPWHKTEEPLTEPNSHIAWYGQNSAAAQGDRYLRLYHVILANPSPDKEVRALTLESAGTRYGLMLLALSVGPAKPEPLPDTWTPPKSPFPDLRPRNGDLVSGEGVVENIAGQPIAGARVQVIGARGLTYGDGRSTPGDPGVGAETTTDAKGHFVLPPIPDNRLYRLKAIAPGYAGTLYRGDDPKSDPIEIRMLPPLPTAAGDYSAHARVVGPDGKPVFGAMVEPGGVEAGISESFGGPQGFTSQVMTGTNGEFTLSRSTPFKSLQVTVTATGLATAKLWLDMTNVPQEVDMDAGATLRGRVLKDGKPLDHVTVGVAGANRNSDIFAGDYTAQTDTNGAFVFEHLPAGTSWDLYGVMNSTRKYGTVPSRLAQTGAVGETTDAGDLNVVPGLKLSGTVRSRHGEALPKGLKVRIGYEPGWDSEVSDIDAEGHFTFDGLAKAVFSVSLDQEGWRLTGSNRSLDEDNPWQMVGRLDDNKDDLVLEVEKGQTVYDEPNENGQLPPQDQAQTRPLSGAETNGPAGLIVSGRVVDDATGQAIPVCTITPGYKPPNSMPPGFSPPPPSALKQLLEPARRKVVPWNERPYWRFNSAEVATNGTFTVEYLTLSSTPVIRVEAAGYEPYEGAPVITNAAGLVVRLKRGTGPSGVVLLPDGRPAAGATVLFAGSGEQFGLTGRRLDVYFAEKTNEVQTTGADGRFNFPTRTDGAALYVSHPEGWDIEPVERAGGNMKIRLEPWAAVRGTLVDANGAPMAGVDLGVTSPMANWQNGDPMVNFQAHATTDAQGRFHFADVPPMRIEINRMIPMPGPGGRMRGWTWRPQTWLAVQPGVTNDLGNVTYDTPPPPPLIERIKRSVGL
jgi:uncharacterized GH25 family protein